MDCLSVLKLARELIATPEQWTKDVAARDAAGRETGCRTVEARCFCSIGALFSAASDDESYSDALRALGGFKAVVHFNDLPGTKHADVIGMFDRAIAARGVA